MPALQTAWADRYAKLLSGELKHAEPPPKVLFSCATSLTRYVLSNIQRTWLLISLLVSFGAHQLDFEPAYCASPLLPPPYPFNYWWHKLAGHLFLPNLRRASVFGARSLGVGAEIASREVLEVQRKEHFRDHSEQY